MSKGDPTSSDIRQVRRAFRDKRLMDLLDQAVAKGWRWSFTSGNHVKLMPPQGTGDEVLILSATSNGMGRSTLNAEGIYKRWLKRQQGENQ